MLLAIGATSASAVVPSLAVESQFRRWTFDEPRVSHRVDQSYLAADLGLQFDSPLRLAVGADLASSVHDQETTSGNLDGLGELRISAEDRFVDDRLRIGAAVVLPLQEDRYTPRQIRVLRVLEIPELEFPLRSPGAGGFGMIEISGQIVRHRTFLAQVGLGLERRGAYALREDGLELDPGDAFRLAVSADQGLAGWILHYGVIHEHPGTTTLDGREAYRNGARSTVRAGIERTRYGRTWGGHLDLLLAASGELLPGGNLLEDPLRAGNRLRWGLRHERASVWPMRIELRGTHYRGFAGSLGHSDRITPALTLGHGFGPGVLEGTFDLSFGQEREGGDLGGVGLGVAWRGGLR